MQKNNFKLTVLTLLTGAFLQIEAVDVIEDSREGIGVFNEKKVVKKKMKKTKNKKHLIGAYIESGLGYDSNPYLTPSGTYKDYAQKEPTDPLGYGKEITPDTKSGLFIPIFLRAAYEYKMKRKIRLLTDFTTSGKYFTDKALRNANEYKTELRGGIRFRFNKYKKEINRIDVKVLVGNVYQIYVDHDDGQAKSSIGGDQSNRYQYKKIGAEATYVYDRKHWDAFILARFEKRDYEDPDSWASLDHYYYRLKFQSGYNISKTFHIGAYYEWRIRDYKDRKSYEIDPTQPSDSDKSIGLTGPAGVVYSYNDVKIFGNYNITKSYKTRLEYLVSQRKDDNQGYSDYLYHRISWINKYKFSKKIRSELKLNYYVYDYKNAYAYNQFSIDRFKLEAAGYRAYLNTKYKFTKYWNANVNLHYREEKSTDKRYEYEELIAMGTLKYRF